MSVAVGLGLMEFPFPGAQGYWRWVDLCEAGRRRLDLADRPALEPRSRCWSA